MKLSKMNSAEITDSKWFAIHTRPRWEFKVSKILARSGVEHYCPLKKVQKQWSDRKKILDVPLFPSYVFVRISDSEQVAIRQIDGVVNFVYWLKTPAQIRDEEITIIKQFLSEYQFVDCEKNVVSINDKVRILSGPLMHREGNVLEIKHKSIIVNLPTLGYNLVATVEKAHIELLTQPAASTANFA